MTDGAAAFDSWEHATTGIPDADRVTIAKDPDAFRERAKKWPIPSAAIEEMIAKSLETATEET